MNILVTIKSCWKYQARRAACRVTWLQDCPWPYKFFVGSHPPLKPFGSMLSNLTDEDDLEICATPDDFKNIAPKIQCMARLAVHTNASHLVIVDDDTYWRPERLQQLLFKMDEVGADLAAYMRHDPVYPQGSFYVLRPPAYLAIAGHDLMLSKGPDDVIVGRVLCESGLITCYHTTDIHVGPHWAEIRRDNTLISTHKCLAGDMVQAHDLWKASYGIC